MNLPDRIPERIRAKLLVEQRTDRVDTPCWVWTGTTVTGGYGSAWVAAGLGTSLHRAIYKLLVGPTPNETLDHLCLVKACANPDHMEPVSHQENKRRGMLEKMPTCACGRPYDHFKKSSYKGNLRRVCRTCTARQTRERRARQKAVI